MSEAHDLDLLRRQLKLPCGLRLRNRIAKSAMSDSLGDGAGNPTEAQARLYRRWAEGGLALSTIGEVQCDPRHPEKPGNLVLAADSNPTPFTELTAAATAGGAQLWAQLGHAGALSHPPVGRPAGPSALDLPGLACAALTPEEVEALPGTFARAAALAKRLGFTGIQVHAAHGFLLSQFLSPLFNRRNDQWGGGPARRAEIIVAVVEAVRAAVGPGFPVAIKINASDLLEGGLDEEQAEAVLELLDATSLDLIEISAGTYFPGAKAVDDGPGGGPRFLGFAEKARRRTGKPLMAAGGFKTRRQAFDALGAGLLDVIALARPLVLDPELPRQWLSAEGGDPAFPRFDPRPPPGAITAWYTLRIAALAEGREGAFDLDPETALRLYDERDAARCKRWNARFGA